MKKLIIIISVLLCYNCAGLVFQYYMMKELQGHRFPEVNPPINQQDLQILQRTKEILSDESKWNSNDDGVCNENDTKWSLLCALKKAKIETLEKNQPSRRSHPLTAPEGALREVRVIIHKLTEGEDFPKSKRRLYWTSNRFSGERRDVYGKKDVLIGFNNTRKFDDIIKVLDESIQKVQVKLQTNPL